MLRGTALSLPCPDHEREIVLQRKQFSGVQTDSENGEPNEELTNKHPHAPVVGGRWSGASLVSPTAAHVHVAVQDGYYVQRTPHQPNS